MIKKLAITGGTDGNELTGVYLIYGQSIVELRLIKKE